MAVEHNESIRAFMVAGRLQSTDEPSRVALTCYQVLHATGDPLADQVLETAYHELMAAADRLDEERRHKFLNSIPPNRELALAWEARQITGPERLTTGRG